MINTPLSFYGSLESLRGVAALAVAVGHCVIAIAMSGRDAAFQQIVLSLTNGRGAVCLCFVLSGFVLTLSLRRSAEVSTGGYREFVLRRLLRIIPVCVLVGILVGVVLQFLHFRVYPSWASAWFREYHHAPPGPKELLLQVALLDFQVNPVTWSLEVEMVASLLLPFLYWLNRRLPWPGKIALLLGLMILTCVLRKVGFHTHWRCVFYWFSFYAGLLAAEHGPAIWARLERFGSWLMAAALLTYAVASRVTLGSGSVEIFLETAVATVLVLGLAFGTRSRLRDWLEHPALRFYGRISYSFYLVHFPVMSLVIGAMSRWLPSHWNAPIFLFAMLAVVSITAGTALSQALYVGVEKPFIRLAKHLCARWQKNAAAV